MCLDNPKVTENIVQADDAYIRWDESEKAGQLDREALVEDNYIDQ